MRNDEFDQYNRTMAGNSGLEGDAVLRAALQAHKQQNIDASSQAGLISTPATPDSVRSLGEGHYHRNKTLNNGQSVLLNGGTTPNGGMSVRSHSSNNSHNRYADNAVASHSKHMNIPEASEVQITSPGPQFSNHAYEMEATEI